MYVLNECWKLIEYMLSVYSANSGLLLSFTFKHKVNWALILLLHNSTEFDCCAPLKIWNKLTWFKVWLCRVCCSFVCVVSFRTFSNVASSTAVGWWVLLEQSVYPIIWTGMRFLGILLKNLQHRDRHSILDRLEP